MSPISEPVPRSLRHVLQLAEKSQAWYLLGFLCSWLACRTGVCWRVTRWILPGVPAAILDFENRVSPRKVWWIDPRGEGTWELALYRATLLFSRQSFLLFSATICSVFASYFLFCPVARLILPPVCNVFDPRLLCLDGKTKENNSSAHARSLPEIEFVCIMGCSLLSCSTLLRHIAIICAAILLHMLVSRGICSEVLRFLLLFRALVLCYFRPFSIVLEPRILSFQPWAKQKKIT